MPEYQELSENEKSQIVINAIRNLEYGIYTLEIEMKLENAKRNPDASKIADLQSQIEEKEQQKLVLK